MTAVLPIVEPTAAEVEQPLLVVEIARVRQLLEAYRDGTTAPPVDREPAGFEAAADRLTRLFGLSEFERQLVLLAAAVELDGGVAALVAELNGGDPRPTFGLALAALPLGHWDALAPGSPLRRWRILELEPGATLTSRPLRLVERVLHWLTGIDALDEELEGIVRLGEDVPLAPSQAQLAEELALMVAAAEMRTVVSLDGDDANALLGVAQALAILLGRVPLVLRAGALPPSGRDLAGLARLVEREALLSGAVPVLVACEEVGAGTALVDELEDSLVVFVGHALPGVQGRVPLHRSVDLPTPYEARGLWSEALGDPAAAALAGPVEEIAQHFRLGAGAIGDIASELEATAHADTQPGTLLKRLCRERSRVGLEGLAERIEPAARWDDLVLPPAHTELLREIVRHVRHRTQVYERWEFGTRITRGLGVTALFAGESGTGKTLAAEVIAGELGLDLYRIDLAATVSKYIGETEKNLRRVFDAAEAGGAVLLFDEADALFGKRGEVKDGHDRYANLEIAYLLQRMESYRGLAILTTNLRSNVDRAFMRRLRFVVQFPFPDPAQRAEIWRRTFPEATPLDGIDPEILARLATSGGSIRAIALSAAFAAAEDGGVVKPVHILQAARAEYAKAERPLTDGETEGIA
jgi:vesicle-fusing ATPase